MATVSVTPRLSQTAMRRAYARRDPGYHGLFVYAVRTTGIFCRPMCPARRPAAANVEFFSEPEAALAAGYRPCKRCRPLDDDASPAWATRLLTELAGDPAKRLS